MMVNFNGLDTNHAVPLYIFNIRPKWKFTKVELIFCKNKYKI